MASHHAFLVLALAVAVLAGTDAAGPPPCAYSEVGAYANQYSGNCGINPAFIVAQVGVSPMAKFTIASAKASIACASHDVKSGKPADIAKCLADKANFCFLDGTPGNWACLSNSNAALAGVPCAGSVYAQWITCQAKYQSDCTGACQWRPDLQRNYTEFLLYRNLTGGAYDTMGYCQPTQYTAKFKTFAEFNTWTQSFGPSDPKQYAAVRGTCQYAKDGFARFQYDSLCYSFNNAKDSSLGLMLGSYKPDGSPNFTGIDATAATKCLTAGCELDYVPANTAFSYGADFFQCSTSPKRRFSLGYFSPLDKGLNAALAACSDISVRYNKALCEAATI